MIKNTSEERKYKPGDVVELTVARVSDLGAFLDAGTGSTSDDILLHRAQQVNQTITAEDTGKKVKVYLYLDPKGRLAASERLPQMREGQVARVEVINVSRDGAFVDIGAERGVFLPFGEMRGKVRRGERIWAKLYRDKSGRQAVTMAVEDDLRRAAKTDSGVKVGDMVTGSVYNVTDQGVFLFTGDQQIAFLHREEMPERVRMGTEFTARVTFVREDGRLNISLRPVKEKSLAIDAAKILTFLEERGGQMPYSDATPPEIIKEKFSLSKAAFKRAMGSLLKGGQVEQRDGWTYRKMEIPQ
ncbi:MAG: S1 RNA-binding domain-containing protein, partial [Sporomusaceae bacterium]|nr:S1 RNA-binding domain-containing protein [Sporomusaceae bacterium]